jgi:hypothetical protein
MSVSWNIIKGLARLQSGDDATLEEWRAAVDDFRRHPDYRPGMGVLNDWQKRTRSITAQDAQARTSYMVQYGAAFGPTRWAVVVSRDVDFGMARVEEALLEGVPNITLRVFRDPIEAEAWVRGVGKRRGGSGQEGPRLVGG